MTSPGLTAGALGPCESIELCVFITAGPSTKVFACGGGDIGGHVLRETTSRGLCGIILELIVSLNTNESPGSFPPPPPPQASPHRDCWRTLKESRKGLGSVSLKNKQPTHTHWQAPPPIGHRDPPPVCVCWLFIFKDTEPLTGLLQRAPTWRLTRTPSGHGFGNQFVLPHHICSKHGRRWWRAAHG